MPLAAILGLSLLLLSSKAEIAPSSSVIGMEQAPQSTPQQKNEPSESPSQNSSGPPSDPQKTQDQSAQAPQPSTVTPPCPDSSQPTSGAKSDCKPSVSNGANAKKHHRAHKAAVSPAPPASAGPTKTVVRNGGTADPTVDLSPAPSSQEASRLETYNQLLATTEANLQKISGRQITASQQDTVKQIKIYMEQAKSAAKDGDVQRAYNLAVKANLLSAELAGH